MAAKDAEVIVVIGARPTENHPVAATFLKDAAARGAELVTMDPRGSALDRYATEVVRFAPGRDVPLLNAMLNVVVQEELYDRQYVAAHTEDFELIREHVAAYTPEEMAPLCNVPADQIRRVARMFARARTALGSRVERRELRVQDVDGGALGSFDLVFVGDLLLHLRDPVGALERLRALCAGELVVADVVELVPTLLHPRLPVARLEARRRPWWWLPNRAALERVVESAGFEIVARSGPYFVPLGPAHPRPGLTGAVRLLGSPGGREQFIGLVRGVPHAAVRARPLP